MKNIILNNLVKESAWNQKEYLAWKRKNVTLRGIDENADKHGIDGNRNGIARLGQGLYMTYLSNAKFAKQYGELTYLVNARPKNPKKFQSINLFEIWTQQNFKNSNSYSEDFLKLGYDGVEIIGREIVNFTPNQDEIRTFSNERGLMNYYEYKIMNQ